MWYTDARKGKKHPEWTVFSFKNTLFPHKKKNREPDNKRRTKETPFFFNGSEELTTNGRGGSIDHK